MRIKIFSQIVKSVPFIYRIWFSLIRKNIGDKVSLPVKGDTLFLDGFPRSGNTYAVNLIRYISPHIKISSHLHSVAGIKIAINEGLPVLVLIRRPIDAISSYYIMKRSNMSKSFEIFDVQLAESIIHDYIDYYKFVLSYNSQISFISFENLIDRPQSLLEMVDDINFSKSRLVDSSKIISLFNDKIAKDQIRKPIERTSFPNKERQKVKQKIAKSIYAIESLKQATEIYYKILQIHSTDKKSYKIE